MNAENAKEVLREYTDEIEMTEERRMNARVKEENYKDVLRRLRRGGIKHLTTITATDLGEEFELIYHLNCEDGTLLNVRFNLPKDRGEIETVTDIFPGAILYEREVMEMLGIKIKDHPDPRRLFLAEDWPEDKHPLRVGEYNYRKILEGKVSEVKEAAKELDLDLEKLLEIEEENKNRESVKSWIEKRIEEEEKE